MHKIFGVLFFSSFLILLVYYLYPVDRIPKDATIDKIVVLKSKQSLLAYSEGKLIVSYKIALGKNPRGDKQYEGDLRTPEGFYIINSKNPNSAFYKNLGISYPDARHINEAKLLSRSPGGDIKIHGLKNGKSYIGKFHRWRNWTDGCIALTNKEMEELYNHTRIGTPIEIRK